VIRGNFGFRARPARRATAIRRERPRRVVERPRRVVERPIRRRPVVAEQRPRPEPRTVRPAAPERRPGPEFVVLDPQRRPDETLTASGFTVIARAPSELAAGDLLRVRAPRGLAGRGIDRLRSLLPGATVARNGLYRPSALRCGPADCPAFTAIRWRAPPSACPADPTLGVVDTRVDPGHPALQGQNLELLSTRSGDRRPSSADHGTAVASLLIGRPDSETPGLLPRARLVAADAFHGAPDGSSVADVYDLARALEALNGRALRVVNLSVSGPANDVLSLVIAGALGRGTVLIAAVGNDGPRAKPAYPAAYAGVTAVTAVDGQLRVFRRAGTGEHVDFAAPGVDLWTAGAGAGGRPRSGTSFAAPFVTATIAVAQLRSATGRPEERVSADPEEGASADPTTLLQARATDLGAPGRDPIFGWGLVNADGLCAPAGS
jgi:hypothetical protein